MRLGTVLLFSILGLCGSFSAFAKEAKLKAAAELEPCEAAERNEYLRFCNRFNSEAGMSRCIAAGKDRYFARCALSLCNRFNSENGGIQCLEVSRDKTYDMEEMQLCNRTSSEQGAISCLSSAGRRVGGGGNDENERRRFETVLRNLRDELRSAQRRLNDGDIHGAQRSIGWTIEDIERELERLQGE